MSIRDFSKARSFLITNRHRSVTRIENQTEALLRGGLGSRPFAFSAGRAVLLRNQLPLHLLTRVPGANNESGRSFELTQITGGNVSFGPDSSAPRVFTEASFSWDSRVEFSRSPLLLEGFFSQQSIFEVSWTR